MSRHRRFHLRDLDLLKAELSDVGLSLPIDENVGILGEPTAIGAWQALNRFAIQPMEGFDADADGTPGELSFRRYCRYAKGGSGLIWFEATAILHEARSNSHQFWLHEGNVDVYARLVEATRNAARETFGAGHELVLLIQLTHSGRYSKPDGDPRPMIAHHSAVLDPRHSLPPDFPLVTDEYLDRLQDTYVAAARLAAQAGFDGVDVKSCHRYLVSELLASFTREGRYGGSLENRSRLLREVLSRIATEVSGIFITTRMNVYDAIPYPYGFGADRDDFRVPDLREPIEVVAQLCKLGIPLLNVTIGNPYYNPHYGRPFDRPVVGFDPPDEHPLAAVARFIQITRQVQEAFRDLPVVASGYTWLRHLMPYVASGVIRSGGATLIGQGRGAFAYPDSPKDVLATGRMDPRKTCITCSGCTQIMRDGTMTGCVVRDREIYAEQYKLGRRFALDRLREEARRCRDCEFATCTSGCPACVDVPRFLKAFADDDIQTAYDVLREANALPEMCACVCPAEVQCEGGCVEGVLGGRAIAIRDIQLVASRIARRRGLTGVRLPSGVSGRNVAVVGGGPAGMGCTIRLLELGHAVTVYEKGNRLGGTPDRLIPGRRYEDAVGEIDAILRPAVSAGRIDVRFGRSLGRDMSLDGLRRRHDAVFLAMGLAEATSLGKAIGVQGALSFLLDVKRGAIASTGRRVAVLGGGNTAVDAAVTARRLGAQDVYVVYRRSLVEMPAWPAERDELIEAGCHVLILTQPLGYETDAEGRLTGLRVARTELGEPDESGRRRPVLVPGTEGVLPVDQVIEAMGQGIDAELGAALSGIERNRHGLVATPPGSQATSLSGVYAGGDLVNGGTTAVQGVAEGMRAAGEIDRMSGHASDRIERRDRRTGSGGFR
jgi:NADPH-dependent glutamate synthase beta subunit-like oxidoreductase/2,4-dienoyl-CoA reductase-like NADH-dependent reductase (Old Yellow Enzyme family)